MATIDHFEVTRRGALTIIRTMVDATIGDDLFHKHLVSALWNSLVKHPTNPITLPTGAKMVRVEDVHGAAWGQHIVVYGYAFDGSDLNPYQCYEVRPEEVNNVQE